MCQPSVFDAEVVPFDRADAAETLLRAVDLDRALDVLEPLCHGGVIAEPLLAP